MKILQNFVAFSEYMNFTLERRDPVHGLRTPNNGFFHRNPKLFGHGQKNWADKFCDIWSILAKLLAPLSMFSNNQVLFLQKALFGIGI